MRVVKRGQSYFGPIAAVVAGVLLSASALAQPAQPAPAAKMPVTENRCGWFDNSSPQNAVLTDKDGDWVVSMQGGHVAEGNWPKFSSKQWVKSGNGSYGYGCTCMRVQANAEENEIVKIISSTPKPLAACRQDPALKGAEPGKPEK